MYFFLFMFNTMKFQSCSSKKEEKEAIPKMLGWLAWTCHWADTKSGPDEMEECGFFSELKDQILF